MNIQWGVVVQYLLLLAYVGVFFLNLPAFGRLIGNRSKHFDAVKACLSILALTFINSFFVRNEAGITLLHTNDFARVVSSALVGIAFSMVLIALLKTEKAMNRAGEQ